MVGSQKGLSFAGTFRPDTATCCGSFATSLLSLWSVVRTRSGLSFKIVLISLFASFMILSSSVTARFFLLPALGGPSPGFPYLPQRRLRLLWRHHFCEPAAYIYLYRQTYTVRVGV